MGVARTLSVALQGLHGALVDVEASITAGLPRFTLIGLPDASLAEAAHRVLAAASNSGSSLAQSRVTANLSPAVLPKHGSAFDLAIALAAMAAAGSVSAASIEGTVHLGELGLDGRVRPVLGVLPAVHAAVRAGARRVMVPVGNLGEARLVPGVEVIPVASLREAAIRHGGEFDPIPVEPILAAPPVQPPRGDELDLSDVIGNEDAIRALIVAAAGGHHLYFLGPPGAGKTMLAERMPGLLPDLDERAALEATSIRSLTELGSVNQLVTRPPYESPHHTASAAALVGGGSSRIRPGAAVRASHGVLFLDEAPEFQPAALDALRQPLESGVITISRASQQAVFPAEFQLVLAANPCPCGLFGLGGECTCGPGRRRSYLNRLSGPLMDRIDLQLQVKRLAPAQLLAAGERTRLTSAQARARVESARAAARERFAGCRWSLNGRAPSRWLTDGPGKLPKRLTAPVERHYQSRGMTMRGFVRVLRVAWTLADLDGAVSPRAEHVGAALALREGSAA